MVEHIAVIMEVISDYDYITNVIDYDYIASGSHDYDYDYLRSCHRLPITITPSLIYITSFVSLRNVFTY